MTPETCWIGGPGGCIAIAPRFVIPVTIPAGCGCIGTGTCGGPMCESWGELCANIWGTVVRGGGLTPAG